MKVIKTAAYLKISTKVKKDSDFFKEGDEEKEAKKWPDYDPNPWAVCTDRVGREDKEKYESCVKQVKEEATKK